MMVSIHALVGISTSLLFYKKINADLNKIKSHIIPMLCNVVLHGIMDVIPHSHLISSYFDIILALLILVFLILFVRKKYLIFIFFCYMGSILPDVIDLGVFRILGFGTFRIFPWHFIKVYNFLNTIYTNYYINILFDILVILTCFLPIFLNRKYLKILFRI